MDLSTINYWAVLVAALASFLIGGAWYSPALFARAWMEENGFSEADLQSTNMVKLFGGAFVLAFVIAFNLACFLGKDVGVAMGTFYGSLTGIGWVATAMGITYLFERKSMRLFLINGGYHVLTFIVMGAIIGAWS